jgi:hypothetical protein
MAAKSTRGIPQPHARRYYTCFGPRSAPRRLPVVSAASLYGFLGVNLDSPGYYIHWGFIQLSLANLIVILLMIVVFVVALFAPFPGGRNRP